MITAYGPTQVVDNPCPTCCQPSVAILDNEGIIPVECWTCFLKAAYGLRKEDQTCGSLSLV